jgi:outer membrane protein TolC
MKRIGISLVFSASLAAAVAQTNAPTRALSLQACITEALKHNFDVQVVRFEPAKAQLNLQAAYAGYDPTFSLSATHSQNDAGGFLNTSVTTNFVPAFTGTNFTPFQSVSTNHPGISINRQNAFNSDLKGSLPWGMTYDLNGNVTDETTADRSSGSVGATVTQPLLKDFWIDGTRLNITAKKNQLKQSEQGLRQQLITTVTDVENAFYELIFARENVTVEQEALGLAQTQLNQDKQRVQVGSLAPLDVQQDESQVASSRAKLIAAQFNLAQSQNTLKNLITDSYLQWHDTDLQPDATLEAVRQFLDLQDSWSQGMALRPDLLQAKLTLEQQGIQLKYDRNQLFPQLDLTGSYGYNGGGVGYSDTFNQYATANRPFYSYGATLSIPLGNVGPRNGYNADKAVEKQYLLKLKQLEQKIMVDIDNAVKQVQSAWESVDATKQARIFAEAALDAEQKKYSVGKSTTFTVLQLQNNLTTARSNEIRSLADYNEALSNLALQEGSTLKRHNLDVSVK